MMDIDRDKLLSRLQIEIEEAWNAKGDDEIVDKLARQHPTLAAELYVFFADLVAAVLDEDELRPELAAADERMRLWLEREGYRKVATAYEEGKASTTTTGTPTSTTPATPPTARTPPTIKSARPTSAQGLLAFLREVTGEGPVSLAPLLGITPAFLIDLADHVSVIPESARRELARRVEKACGIKAAATLAVLNESQQGKATMSRKAASRSKAYKKESTNYADIVNRSSLNDEQRRYWLSLA
jgi:hypothetical protein